MANIHSYKDNYRGEGILEENARPKVIIFWKSRHIDCFRAKWSLMNSHLNGWEGHWSTAETMPWLLAERATECQLACPVSVLVHTAEWIHGFSEYEATLANFFYMKYLEYVSETLWDYCLDVCV